MYLRIVTIIAFALSTLNAYGQAKITQIYTKSNIAKISLKELPAINNFLLEKEELRLRKTGRADRFAKAQEVNINPLLSGEWVENGPVSIWQYRIKSESAHSLNFGFERYAMPSGGSLIIYTADKSDLIGPFTVNDNDTHKQLWTPVVFGDDVIMEIKLPTNQKDKLDILLKSVNHDFMDIQKSISGSCNVDVACGAEEGYAVVDNYRDIIESVGAYTLNGISQCSGALINNARNDCRPYFLTADHCNVRDFNSASVVVYWDFNNSICRTPGSSQSGQGGDGSFGVSNTGARVIARYSDSDFTLLELDDPVDPSTGPYFAGWDKRGVRWDTVLCVHHPRVEEKRISFDFNRPTFEVAGDGDSLYYRVLNWELGTTEGGSSGSPLFNANGRIVAQLFGGQASCGNNEWDEFGWIGASWEGGGTPETRLKDWLDPDNSQMPFIEGNSCTYIVNLDLNNIEICTRNVSSEIIGIQVNNEFTDDVALSVLDLPTELQVSFNQNPIPSGGNTSIRINNLDQLGRGDYFISILAEDGVHSSTTILNITVDNESPDAPSNISPQDGEVVSSLNTVLEWTGNDLGYDVELSNDINFSNLIIDQRNLLVNQVSTNNLEAAQVYFWRVRAKNNCGYGDWSIAYAFEISDLVCFEKESIDTPKNIGTSSSEIITSILTMTESGIIEDINVSNITGQHSWLSDLEMKLKSPLGTEIILVRNICEGEQNFNVSFDDDAASSNLPCPFTDGNAYAPLESLSIFKGENILGDWTLTITDNVFLDGGSLRDWGLEFCISESLPAPTISLNLDTISVCRETSYEFQVFVSENFQNTVSLSLSNVPEDMGVEYYPQMVAPGGSSFIILNNLFGFEGKYDLKVNASDGTSTVSSDLHVAFSGGEPTLLFAPTNGQTEIPLQSTFVWMSIPTVTNYQLQIAKDAAFTDLVVNRNMTNVTYFSENELTVNTDYYWRVITVTECGGSTSEVFSFTTVLDTSLDELIDAGIKVFPNPVNDLLTIDFGDNNAEDYRFEIVDIHGKTMYRSSVLRDKMIKVDVSDYSAGIYLLRIADTDKVRTAKISVID